MSHPSALPPVHLSTLHLSTLAQLIDRIIPDPAARDRAKLALLDLQAAPGADSLPVDVPTAACDFQPDAWTSRARPTFLYVIYAMILWALPVGLLAAFSPAKAHAIAAAMKAYLDALPEPLYALFGTGYLGYATLRQWGKAKGTDS